MKIIKNIFLRFFISLFSGGIVQELWRVSYGDESAENPPIMTPTVVLVYTILSLIVLYDKYKYYYFPQEGKRKREIENIDDIEIEE